MNDTLTKVQRELRDEAKRLRDEATKLESAAKAIGSNGASPRKAKSTKSKGRGRPKGSGKRGAQALELVKSNPGITTNALAEQMGIKANYLYRVLPELPVQKQGDGWVPYDAEPVPA